jgi:predicted ATPase
MITSMKEHPSQELVSFLSECATVGNKFNTNILEKVLSNPSDMERLLIQSVNEGFIIPEDGSDSFIYHFVHDSIQQAAENILEGEKRFKRHYDISMHLFRTSTKEELLTNFKFEIANHMKFGKNNE